MRKSLKDSIETSISHYKDYRFDFYYKYKDISEPGFVNCSITFPIWFPVKEFTRSIYKAILSDFIDSDFKVSIVYVKQPKSHNKKISELLFFIRDSPNNIIWSEYNYYQNKWEYPPVKFRKGTTKKHLIKQKQRTSNYFVCHNKKGEFNPIEIKVEYLWPSVYSPTSSEEFENLLIFLIRSNENIKEIYTKKYYYNPSCAHWHKMNRNKVLQHREAPYFIDDKKLESYQLDSSVSDYQSKCLSNYSGNDAGEITGGMYEGDWTNIKESLGY